MKKAIGTLVLAGLPALAHAQTQTQVPAIIQGTAAAAVSVAGSPAPGDEPAPAKADGAQTDLFGAAQPAAPARSTIS